MAIKQKSIKTIYSLRETMEHQSWCLKNNIKIYYEPIDYFTGRIVLIDKGIPEYGRRAYKSLTKNIKPKDDKWWEIIHLLYTNKYLKYNAEKRV